MNMNLKENIVLTIDTTISIANRFISLIAMDEIDYTLIINLVDSLTILSNSVLLIECDAIDIDEFNTKLAFTLNALEEKDIYQFSDNLNYELIPLLEYWKENIN